MIFFDPAHSAIDQSNGAAPTLANGRLGRKTGFTVPAILTDKEIDEYLSSLPPPPIDLTNEKLLKRKNELFSIFGNYTRATLASLANLNNQELEELKGFCLDEVTNTEKRTIKINNNELPLHINGRLSRMLILSELYEHYLEPNSGDLRLLLDVLDNHAQFPVSGIAANGEPFHRGTVENSALLKSYITRTLAKAVLQLEDPLELQLSIITSLQRIDKMLKEENRKSDTLSNAYTGIHKAIFITAYYYNQFVAKRTGKRLKPLPEWLAKNSLKVLSMDAKTVLESENLQP